MLKSRDIDRLRPDVAANCRVFVTLCQAAGHRVLVTDTVRDDAYQMDCYKRGTGGKPPATFHSVKAGLAFDIVKLTAGGSIDYNDGAFWTAVDALAQQVGFSWGFALWGRDKPHMQWDQQGKYNDRDIRAGRYPPAMPRYQEGEHDMTAEDVKKIVEQALAERDAAKVEINAKTAPWAKEAWDAGKAAGIFDGTRPGAPLTRQEAALTYQRLGLLKGAGQ